MTNQIVLLEGRKEVTTFLLDDGDISSKDVVTETGQDIGYEYTNKLYPEDTVTISPNSQIGKEMVKKYTGDSDEVPIGIIVNDPVVMDNGQRKASVLVLGQLYRLKLASGVTGISPADKIKLGTAGAIKDTSGDFIALHPVADSDEYNYINCYKRASAGATGEKGDTGDAGPAGPKGDTGDTGSQGVKGDTGDTGEKGESIDVYNDTAHRQIMFTGETTSAIIDYDDITGPKGDTGASGVKGDTGDTGGTGKAGAQILRTSDSRDTSGSMNCPNNVSTYGHFIISRLLDQNPSITEVNAGDWVLMTNGSIMNQIGCIANGNAYVVQYYSIKGDKGDTGASGVKGDTGDTGAQGVKGDTGDTGATGPVNLASSLDTTDTTNAIKNAPVATAIENLQTSIGTITSTQTANLNLLGS